MHSTLSTEPTDRRSDQPSEGQVPWFAVFGAVFGAGLIAGLITLVAPPPADDGPLSTTPSAVATPRAAS